MMTTNNCPKTKLITTVKKKLREKDLRSTPQRQAILAILLKSKDKHLTAEEVYALTRDDNPEIGLATVYRTLDLFVELGVVHKLEFGEKGARYELSSQEPGHYHHHLICIQCNSITEFNDDLLDDLEEVISQESGFLITDHTLRFYGLCRHCQEDD